MVCLWKSHNLDKRAFGTYMRVTVNKAIDKCGERSGRVLDSRPKGRGFEPPRRHCVVSFSKTH